MDMPHKGLTTEEIARCGEEFYEREVREKVEADGANHGSFLALDVLSGDYELADRALVATSRLRQRCPDALPYLMRVGRSAAFRLGDLGACRPAS